MARKAIGQKKRFEIFKRDGFICQYCGAHPPAAILHIDHIVPVASDGSNDIDNLITACSKCNQGKGANDLGIAPQTVIEKSELLKDKEDQLKAYNKLLGSKKRRENKLINQIQEVFTDEYEGYLFAVNFRDSIRHNFLPKLDQNELMMAINKACAKCQRPDQAIKYFCGICWNIIRENDK